MGRERDDMVNAKKTKDAAIISVLMTLGGFALKMAKNVYDNKKTTEINGKISDINSKFYKNKNDKAQLNELKRQREQFAKDDNR